MKVRISEDFRIAFKRLKKRHKSLEADFERLLISLLDNPYDKSDFENISNTFLRDILKRMD